MASKNYTNADVTVTPWCYMPPEMHFDSPADLKEAFWKFHLSRIQDELNNPVSMNFLPPANKFEKVRSKRGKYVLIPTSLDPAFLFRGQRGIWFQCLPTLYRKKLTEDEYILGKLEKCKLQLKYLVHIKKISIFAAVSKYNENEKEFSHKAFAIAEKPTQCFRS